MRQLAGPAIAVDIWADPASGRALVDPGQFEQLILNLVVNARDAMPGGGRLTVAVTDALLGEAEADRLGRLPPGRYVALRVADTGTGMDDATRRHLFEPFFTTKPPGQGTGLGLATVYGIVRQSGGASDVRTAPGAGATFTIFLPTVCTPADQAARPHGHHG